MQFKPSIRLFAAVTAVAATACAGAYSSKFTVSKPVAGSVKRLAVAFIDTGHKGVCSDVVAPIFVEYGKVGATEVATEIQARYGSQGLNAAYVEPTSGPLPAIYVSPTLDGAGPPGAFVTVFPGDKSCPGMLMSKSPATSELVNPDAPVTLPSELKGNVDAVLLVTTHTLGYVQGQTVTYSGTNTTTGESRSITLKGGNMWLSSFGYVLVGAKDGAILGQGHKTANSCQPVGPDGKPTALPAADFYSYCTKIEAKKIAEEVGVALTAK